MSSGRPGLLATLLEEDELISAPPSVSDEIVRSPNLTIKNKKNNKAATQARAAGARTATERELEALAVQQKKLLQQQQSLQKVQKVKQVADTMLDKVGGLPAEKIYSKETYNAVKQSIPGLTEDKYFNQFAPSAARRKALTQQLAQLPMGTKLSRQTLQQLQAAGIDNPNQYMRLTTLAPEGTLKGSFQRAAIGAAGRAASPETRGTDFLAGIGSQIKQQEDILAGAAASQLEEDSKQTLEKIKALGKQAESGGLDERQKFTSIRELKNDLKKDAESAKTLNQFFNNVRDFSDPEKSKGTIRLDDDFGVLTGTGKQVITSKDFQNVNDIGLVYSLIKMLDPGSVVREGEIALAGKSLGLLDSIGVKTKNVFKGETLSPQQRAGILNIANKTFISGARSLNDVISSTEETAVRFGLEKDLAVPKDIRQVAQNVKTAEEAITKFESELGKQQASGKDFSSVQEAEAADLPSGTRITINGRPAIIE